MAPINNIGLYNRLAKRVVQWSSFKHNKEAAKTLQETWTAYDFQLLRFIDNKEEDRSLLKTFTASVIH